MFAAPASWRHVMQPDRRVVEAVEQREEALARDAEDRVGAVDDELVDEHLAAVAAHSIGCSKKTVGPLELRLVLVGRDRRRRSSACPPTRRGSTSTRTNAVGSVSDAAANTGSGPVSYHHSNGPYSCDSPCVSIRIGRRAGRAVPGPGCVCRCATPPGGKSTRSQRTIQPTRSSSTRRERRPLAVSSQTSAWPSTCAAPKCASSRATS